MNAEEIVKALRWLAKDTEFVFAADRLNNAADLIESLTAQLTEAIADMPHLCEICNGRGGRKCMNCIRNREADPYTVRDDHWNWRGPQKGEPNGTD